MAKVQELHVNRERRRVDADEQASLLKCTQRAGGPDRRQVRMRRGSVRSLHGTA